MRTRPHRIGALVVFLGVLAAASTANAAAESRDGATRLSSTAASRAEVLSGPTLSVSPQSIPFGSVLVGQVATRALSISNAGPGSATITNLLVSNPRFTTSFTSPVTIPAGGVVGFNVVFTPTSAMSENGTITVVANANFFGSSVIPVTGAGILEPGGELGAGRVLAAPGGEFEGDQLGIGVASAGDLNGDGFDDVIVGAWTNDVGGADAGRAYVYLGGSTPNDVPDLTLQGSLPGDNFGVSVSRAGDVNGDGFPDVLVGAYRSDGPGTDAGRAYLFHGGPGMDAIPDRIFTAQAAGDYFGVSVSSAGDVNGDGFDDVIIGAFLNDFAGGDAGRAYVYFGGPSMDTVADWVLTGEASGDNFGWSVAGGGDLNGDGFDDVIIGALHNDAGGSQAGRAYVYYGGVTPNTTPDWTLTGLAAGDRLGVRLGSAGDVNGDGHPDIIVGADHYVGTPNFEGHAYLFYGGPGADTIADRVFTGETLSSGYGASVAGAGDVNGDGFDDLLVGAWLDSTPGDLAGRAFLYYGGPSGDTQADAVFTGQGYGDRLGDLVSSAGDFDGDGRDDVVIGAYFNDATAEDAGRAYIVSLAGEHAPPVVTAPASVSGAAGAPIAFTVTASDPEGGVLLSLTAAPLPAGATFNANATKTSGDFAWTPTSLQVGSFSVVFTASNGAFASATTSITVAPGNQPPTVTAPASVLAAEGTLITFGVQGSDPEGGHVTLGAVNRPAGALFIDFGNNTGQFNWTPGFGQTGTFEVSFTGRDDLGGVATPKVVAITVDNVNRGPIAVTGGPYAGVVNVPIAFDGTGSSDPDGDPLTHQWTFGDLGSGSGPTPLHAYAAGGIYVVGLTVNDGSLSATASTSATVQSVFPALAFLEGGNATTRLNSGKAATCVQIEPVDRSYANTSVSIGTIAMISTGTGSVDRIYAAPDKTTLGADRNHNGVDEITACFSKTDLRNLFGGLSGGRHTVAVVLEGSLTTGGVFRTTLEMVVVASGNSLAASVSPNPLNPAGTITFRTTRPGAVTVTLFDAAGRLVRTALVESNLPAGYHDAAIDGRRSDGSRLPSGVYFYRVDTAEGAAAGRFVVLK